MANVLVLKPLRNNFTHKVIWYSRRNAVAASVVAVVFTFLELLHVLTVAVEAFRYYKPQYPDNPYSARLNTCLCILCCACSSHPFPSQTNSQHKVRDRELHSKFTWQIVVKHKKETFEHVFVCFYFYGKKPKTHN